MPSPVEAPIMQPEAVSTPLPVDQVPSAIEFSESTLDLKPTRTRNRILKLSSVTGIAGATVLTFYGAVGAQDSENPQTAVLIESDCIPLADTGTVPGQTPTELLPNGDSVVFPENSPSPTEVTDEEEEELAQLSGDLTEEEIEDQIAKDFEEAANADESQILTDEPTTDNSTNQDVEINPEEVLVEEDTDTTIECPPGMVPNPNLVQPESTPETREIQRLTAKELIKNIATQPEKETNKTSIKKVRKSILDLWKKYPDVLKNFRFSYYGSEEKVTKKTIKKYLEAIEKGYPHDFKDKNVKQIDRQFATGDLLGYLADIATFSDNNDLYTDAENASDHVMDYAVTNINPGQENKVQKAIAEYIDRFLPYWNPNN